MSSDKGIVIIGGGACGCSIAYHLAKQGVPSRIIERDAVASQASGKAWAVISAPARLLLFLEGREVPQGSMQPCIGLFQKGFRQFPQLAMELKEGGGIDIGYGELPCIYTVSEETEERYLKKRMFELANEGLEASWIEARDVKARIPDINPRIRGGVLYPGYKVEPYKYTLSLLQAAEARGTVMKQGEAVGFRHQGTKVTAVTLTTGEIEADAVVIAMGPWSGQGTSWLGKEIPQVVKRSQCLKVEVPQRLPPYRLLGNQAAIIPQVDGTVILGDGGASDSIRQRLEDFDISPTEEAKIKIATAANELLPRLEEARLVEHRAGLYACQPNGGLPMLGRFFEWDNVYIATWFASWGIQWSSAVGPVMADLIVKGYTEEPIEALSPAELIG
ncbi:NAD(P)/FAD-dependent oxidoreductase [Chloroflexota bacterium]